MSALERLHADIQLRKLIFDGGISALEYGAQAGLRAVVYPLLLPPHCDHEHRSIRCVRVVRAILPRRQGPQSISGRNTYLNDFSRISVIQIIFSFTISLRASSALSKCSSSNPVANINDPISRSSPTSSSH